MKAITREWLTKASEDLAAAQALLAYPDLTNTVAFHAQQALSGRSAPLLQLCP
ncbi:MAG: hypothetical protein DDG58_09405 [Ardenticatenia bacterium]|nr:MAG: hypothetical protein DDG58_09405 [Ardenticatenia bacterium]